MLPLPNMQPVRSSQIAAVGYDASAKAMLIRFNTGALYRYDNVEPATFEALRSAKSVGSFFHKNIKPYKDRYPYTKMDDATPTTTAQ